MLPWRWRQPIRLHLERAAVMKGRTMDFKGQSLSLALCQFAQLLGLVTALTTLSCSSQVTGKATEEDPDANGSAGGADSGSTSAATGGSQGDDGRGDQGPELALCERVIANDEVACNDRGNESLSSDDTWSAGCRRFGELTLSGGKLTIETDPFGEASIIVADRVVLEMGAEISLSEQGYAGGIGPGKGIAGAPFSSGAGHGGKGGDRGVEGGATYGDREFPTTAGSGGGGPGGRGGGALLICATEEIVVDGVIETDGGDINPGAAGGGAGGSLLLISPLIRGSGRLSATGGDALSSLCSGAGASGGGGRIALRSSVNEFEGSVAVSSGAGCSRGDEGTIHRGDLPE